MTVIVGVVHGGTMWLGGDGRSVYDTAKFSSTAPKVWKYKNHFMMGCAGDAYLCDLVENAHIPHPDPEDYDDLRRWCLSNLVPSIRRAFSKVTMGKKDTFEALVMVGGLMFTIDNDLAVDGPILNNYMAVGGAAPYALGSLCSTLGKYTPRTRIRKAFEAAELFDSTVGPPFSILKMQA